MNKILGGAADRLQTKDNADVEGFFDRIQKELKLKGHVLFECSQIPVFLSCIVA